MLLECDEDDLLHECDEDDLLHECDGDFMHDYRGQASSVDNKQERREAHCFFEQDIGSTEWSIYIYICGA